jgi:KaiC/GvpD/RAD55 family RecA-like ATPase
MTQHHFDSMLGFHHQACIALLGEAGADGSFLLHHFISKFVKSGTPMLIISFTQIYQHYVSIGRKLVGLMTAIKF